MNTKTKLLEKLDKETIQKISKDQIIRIKSTPTHQPPPPNTLNTNQYRSPHPPCTNHLQPLSPINQYQTSHSHTNAHPTPLTHQPQHPIHHQIRCSPFITQHLDLSTHLPTCHHQESRAASDLHSPSNSPQPPYKIPITITINQHQKLLPTSHNHTPPPINPQ